MTLLIYLMVGYGYSDFAETDVSTSTWKSVKIYFFWPYYLAYDVAKKLDK